jgi:hypothetical protein
VGGRGVPRRGEATSNHTMELSRTLPARAARSQRWRWLSRPRGAPAAARSLTRGFADVCPCRNRCPAASATCAHCCLTSSPTRLPRRADLLRPRCREQPPRPLRRPGLLFPSEDFESLEAPRARMRVAIVAETIIGSVHAIPFAEAHRCTLPWCWRWQPSWGQPARPRRRELSVLKRVLRVCSCVFPPCSGP